MRQVRYNIYIRNSYKYILVQVDSSWKYLNVYWSHLGDESDSEDESGATKTRTDDALFANTNLQEAQTRDKLNRDKMAEVKLNNYIVHVYDR